MNRNDFVFPGLKWCFLQNATKKDISRCDADMHWMPFRVYPQKQQSLSSLVGPYTLQRVPEHVTVATVSGCEQCGNRYSGMLPFEQWGCVVFDSTCSGITSTASLGLGEFTSLFDFACSTLHSFRRPFVPCLS